MDEIVYTKGTPEGQEKILKMVDKRRRISQEPKKSFEATQMWDVYQEIARRIVLGQKNIDIAEDLGITHVMVSYVRNSPIVQEQINKLHADANKETSNIAARIKSLAPHALDLLEDVIVKGRVKNEEIPARIRLRHAENLLDRAGYAPPKEVRSLNLHGHYTSEDIEAIKQRALSRAAGQAIVVND